MLEMRYQCDVCGAETVNPTRVHVCASCNRRVCSDCLERHQEGHRQAAEALPDKRGD